MTNPKQKNDPEKEESNRKIDEMVLIERNLFIIIIIKYNFPFISIFRIISFLLYMEPKLLNPMS